VSTQRSRDAEIWHEVSKRAGEDARFKQRLLDDPRGVLAEAGHHIPEDVEVAITELEPGALHLVLPSDRVREYLDAHEIDASLISEYNAPKF
jgi:hypothetical protein